MKTLIRTTLFSALSVYLTQYVIGGFVFGHSSALLLYILALTLLHLFMKPLLSLISLPDEGLGFLFMSFVLTMITTYVLTLFIPMFSLRDTTISELIIFGFVLPSKRLTVAWAVVFSSLLLSVLMFFFSWMCNKERK